MPLTPEQIETLRRPVQHAADEMLRKGPEWLYDRCIAAGMADARFAALMQEFAGVRKAEIIYKDLHLLGKPQLRQLV